MSLVLTIITMANLSAQIIGAIKITNVIISPSTITLATLIVITHPRIELEIIPKVKKIFIKSFLFFFPFKKRNIRI